MKIDWTGKASADLVRLHRFLATAAPDAAARVVQALSSAPDRLVNFPRIGEKLDVYHPPEVRRIIVGHYELRYEIGLHDHHPSPVARPRRPSRHGR